jgi:uncharacterized protein YktB (UPF0637 family)
MINIFVCLLFFYKPSPKKTEAKDREKDFILIKDQCSDQFNVCLTELKHQDYFDTIDTFGAVNKRLFCPP